MRLKGQIKSFGFNQGSAKEARGVRDTNNSDARYPAEISGALSFGNRSPVVGSGRPEIEPLKTDLVRLNVLELYRGFKNC